ncbi:phospholipid-binding protein [Corynebacterium doosanense CAU 212 = DSM 45436]|uniref:Phospholipid-binding protein n=1 Tax=Corynebacterium doosanense CAU 212 = DSM 45436 TaxID=558173 RepID=A0A097IG42_9CORY|nr:YbhB/YbcL family Raf kinase inhibitor-like protein [Corynebacterium doosanense]AIT61101.1 phospholipid-binding protein [Corynebacterium doosanense CAU 212 = DSM 45436]
MTNYNQSRFPGPDPYAPLKDLPTFTLTSTDIRDGEQLQEDQLADKSISPQLSWADLPEGTKSLAVTCLDPDAPTGAGFWHWSAFNIPVDTTELPSGAGSKADLGVGAVSLRNDSGAPEYYGAAPPEGHGPHRYLYAVHAVDVEKLDIDEDSPATVLGFNLYFHSIGRTIIWGWAETE